MATRFEKRVWRFCALVPKGNVTTYAEIARRIGNNRASRAVGNALNKNPNAPAVPCHRVVKSDGSIGGYAYGIKNKIRLLRSERVAVRDGKVVDFARILFRA